jgi:hypothetical protein
LRTSVNLPRIIKREKNVILSSALASSAITVTSLLLTEGSDSVILFVFLEPVVLSCVMPFLLEHQLTSKSAAAHALHSIADAAIFCAFLGAGAVIISLSRATAGEPILATLFFLPFAIFVGAATTLFCLLFGAHPGQLAGATVATLIIATPFYISYVLKIAPQTARLLAVQFAVSINPVAVASASILQFDWLRSPRMYSLCPIGGEQYPFYYPSCVKVAVIYLACGLLLAGAVYLVSRRVRRKETKKYG